MTLLEKHSVAELDALAEELQATDYPADAKKDAKVAALLPLVGDEYKPKETYTVELKDGFNGGQFQADLDHVELTPDSPKYSTTNRNLYTALLELPFLKAAS